MRRLLIGLILALAVSLPVAENAPAQAPPQFQLGFATLSSLIPDVVGQPLENEHFNAATNDSLQRTTTGLMVWMKSDNVAAFTDGSTTWLLGPLGLQSRPNGTQFDWEATTQSATTSASSNGVTMTFSRAPDGNWVGRGTVQNLRGVTEDVEVNVVGFDPNSGVPLIDAPTAFVSRILAGGSAPISVLVPTMANAVNWQLLVTSHPSSENADFTLDVGASRPLDVDPSLAGAVNELRKVDGGDQLVRTAAESGVLVQQSPLPASVLGDFVPDERTITISSALDSYSAWVRATVLAHELQHAADAAAGFVPQTTAQCLQVETNAFQRQSTVWSDLWRNNLPADIDQLHAELNDVATTVANNPQAFAAELARRYRSECGALRQ